MTKYFSLVIWFVLFVFFMLADVMSYSNYKQPHHSLIPLFIFITLSVIAGVFTAMAIYETFKHRNDKEPW